MKRLEELIEQLNILEKHMDENAPKEVIELKNQLLSSLSKSGSFKDVYELSKKKDLGIIKYLVPYIVYKDKNGKYLYVLKSISQFNNDYEKTFNLLKQFKDNNLIDVKEYIFLKENIRGMYNKFSMQFCTSNLDKLDEKEREKYDECRKDINKMYKDYIDYIGELTYLEEKENFHTLHESTKRVKLIYQNEKMLSILGIENKLLLFISDFLEYFNTIYTDAYSINVIDSRYYSLELLTLEQIYKIKCSELLKESIKNKKVINALLEDIDFYKSNYIKEDNKKRDKKYKKKS